MTEAQRKKLESLCGRYNVPFREADYFVYSSGAAMMAGWAEGWVGGRDSTGKTLYVGVSPEGESHS